MLLTLLTPGGDVTPQIEEILMGMTVGELVAAGVFIIGLAGLAIKVFKGMRRFSHFLDDWGGEPERPGQPKRPGVLERLERVEHQLSNNGGSSMKDAVDRIEQKLETHVEQATEVHRQSAIAEQEMWKAIESISHHREETHGEDVDKH